MLDSGQNRKLSLHSLIQSQQWKLHNNVWYLFTHCSSVSIYGSEKVNASYGETREQYWVEPLNLLISNYYFITRLKQNLLPECQGFGSKNF